VSRSFVSWLKIQWLNLSLTHRLLRPEFDEGSLLNKEWKAITLQEDRAPKVGKPLGSTSCLRMGQDQQKPILHECKRHFLPNFHPKLPFIEMVWLLPTLRHKREKRGAQLDSNWRSTNEDIRVPLYCQRYIQASRKGHSGCQALQLSLAARPTSRLLKAA